MNDLEYMARALELARRGQGTTSPNPMVGAVVVGRDGAIVGQGYHQRAGGPHAEVRALDEAGELARGAVLYCTLEPCCHTGRTGPCVERITAAGVSRVVAATADVDPRVAGQGFEALRGRGISVDVGVGRDEALKLNRAYFTFKTEGRPFVIMKAATSLDNAIARRRGESTAISSPESWQHAQRVRAEVDAIGVGSETVLVDDPRLTVRDVRRSRPLVRVVFDRRLRVAPAARLFSTLEAGPVIIVTTPEAVEASPEHAAALTRAGAEVEPIAEGTIAAALRRLAERDVMSLVLEGGAAIHRSAWEEGVVDAVHLYVAPVTLGTDAVRWLDPEVVPFRALSDRQTVPLGVDVWLEGYVHGID